MKAITKDERPIGKGSKYTCFFSEDIVKETEKAFLVNVWVSEFSGNENRWLPKSKMLSYTHIDTRDLVYNGKDYVRNENYGKEMVQYFISNFFIKQSPTEKALMEICASGSLSEQRMNKGNQLIIGK